MARLISFLFTPTSVTAPPPDSAVSLAKSWEAPSHLAEEDSMCREGAPVLYVLTSMCLHGH